MGRNLLNHVGQRFGTMVIIGGPDRSFTGTAWLCRCDCGEERTIFAANLRAGRFRCPCSSDSNHPLYGTWRRILDRCNNPSNKAFKNYGGRGITVCQRWSEFDNFKADMGVRPEGHSIDRIDNDGNYSPENCRWATDKQQASNTRANVYLEYRGQTKTMTDWANYLGISREAMRQRILRGLPDCELFFKGRMGSGGPK